MSSHSTTNGVAERENQHVIAIVHTLGVDSFVPSNFKVEASDDVYFINIQLATVLHDWSPYLCLFWTHANYHMLHTFRCVYYILAPPQFCKKILQAARCVFLGYRDTQKGLICNDPSSAT